MTRADRLSRVPVGAVALYAALACGLAWVVALPIWVTGGPQSPALGFLIPVLGAAMMFTPTVAVLVVLFMLRMPKAERLRFLGMWPLRPAKRVVGFMVGALFAPAVIVALGIAVSAVFGWVTLDLREFSGFASVLAEQLSALDPELVPELPPIGLLVALQLLSIPLGAVVNAVFAFGEEIGWRGWLLPALLPLGTWPALLVSGVIWGVWHAPLILVGYNFGLTDARGVLLMVGGCVAWGAVLGWTRLRTGSVWPAVFGHGALNASAGMLTLVIAAGTPADPAVVGPLGVVVWGALAVVLVALVLTGQFRAQPELAPTRRRDSLPDRNPDASSDPLGDA